MNKQIAIAGFGGLLTGFIIMAIVGLSSLSGTMMLEDESRFDDFDTTVEQFEQKVREAGWSILTVHDMQEALRRHGHDVKSVKVLELCSARYSAEILKLDDERIVAPLMPCRVAIYEKNDGKTYISRMDIELVARPYGGVIQDVMQMAAGDIEDMIQQVIK